MQNKLRNKAIEDIYATGAHLSPTRMKNAGVTRERADEIVDTKFEDADYDWTKTPELSVDGPIHVNKFLQWCFYNDTYKECISTKTVAYGNWENRKLPPRTGYIYLMLSRHVGDGDPMSVKYGYWERDIREILTKNMGSLLQSTIEHFGGIDRIERPLQTLSCALELAPCFDHKIEGHDAYVKLQRQKNGSEQKSFLRRESANEGRGVPTFEKIRELTRDKFGETSKQSLCIDLYAETRLRKSELQDLRVNPPKDQRHGTYITVTEDTVTLKRERGYKTRKPEQYELRDDHYVLSTALSEKIRSYIDESNDCRLFQENECASTFMGHVLTEIDVKTPEWKGHSVRLLGRSYVSTERAKTKRLRSSVEILQRNYSLCEEMDHTAKAASRLINNII